MVTDNKKASFYEKIKLARKILVLDLGFLGDTIHLLPSLNIIREAFPDAFLEVMVGDHIQGVMKVVPWVDKVTGYPRFPKGPKWYQDLGRVWRLRKESYDAIINLNGSDRSSILTWAIGAPLRLGRVPPKPSAFWKHCFTHTVEFPRRTRPLYQQLCECLGRAGFPNSSAAFSVTLPQDAVQKVGYLLDNETDFIHVSPFTTLDYKELPEGLLVDFLGMLQDQGHKLVLSCAPNEREKSKLESLLKALGVNPWKTFPGTLNLMELAALIQKSKLHMGGDSGALHMGLMTNTPTLSWFRDYEGKMEWLPSGKNHAHVIGVSSGSGLQGVTSDSLYEAFQSLKIE